MAKFLLRRLANYVILVAVATSGAFILASLSLKPRANFEGRNPPPPEAVVDQRLTELNLNDKTPVLERYATWAKGVLHGDFGKTWEGDSVNAEMGRRIGVSLRLLLIATIIGGLLGVLAGAWGAIRQYQFSDHAVTMLSFVILSIPVFVLAVVLEIAAVGFNNAVGSKVFEYTGEFTPGLQGGFWTHAIDRLKHLVLPSVTLSSARSRSSAATSAAPCSTCSARTSSAPRRPRGCGGERAAQARAAHRAHPGGHLLHLQLRDPHRGRDVHREDLRLARHGRVVRGLGDAATTRTPSPP
jgi:ABC-type dipeptide/oligopeptide/nickel transport system permease component